MPHRGHTEDNQELCMVGYRAGKVLPSLWDHLSSHWAHGPPHKDIYKWLCWGQRLLATQVFGSGYNKSCCPWAVGCGQGRY